MRKYGMLYSTIKYWQDQSRQLMMLRGTIPHVSMGQRYQRDYLTMSARDIAHTAIMLAQVQLEVEYL